MQCCERARDLAHRLGHAAGEAWYGREMGSIAQDLGQTERARAHLERAIAQFDALGIAAGTASASNVLGLLEWSAARFERALSLFTRYIEIARQLGRRQSESTGLGNLAGVYMELGNPWRALELNLAALEIARGETDCEHVVAWTLTAIGDAQHALGNTGAARQHLLEALERQRASGDERYAAMTLRSLGALYLKLRRFDQAIAALDEAVTLGKRTGNAVLEAGALVLHAMVHFERDDHALALETARSAVHCGEAVGDRVNASRARVVVAACEVALGVASDALEAFGPVIVDARATNSGAVEVFALERLVLALEGAGQFKAALAHSSAVRALEKRLARSDLERLALTMNAQLNQERDRFDFGLVRARTEALESLNARLERANAENAALLVQLREQTHRLERLSHEDALTGVYNRRHLETELPRAWSQAQRQSTPLTVAMLDIDHFKRVNDTASHRVGDEVLKRIAGILQTQLRLEDTVCRYGGEEFVVLLPDCDLAHAVDVLERVRVAVRDFDWTSLGVNVPVTLSAGLASSPQACDAPNLVTLADDAQYRAKARGRDQIAWHGDDQFG